MLRFLRLSVSLLFCISSFASYGQVKLWQVQADTIDRTIPINGTINESGTDYKELQYESIDSLVKQIAIDSLGLDTALWVSSGNYAINQKSTLSRNTIALGLNAGNNSTGTSNLFLGANAGLGASTGATGDENIGLGVGSLQNHTTGRRNFALGSLTLRDLTTGSNNVAIGYAAGLAINGDYNFTAISGSFPVAIGSGNIGIGRSVGRLNTGSFNLALGYQNLFNNTSGGGNIVFGYRSLYNNIAGSNNVVVGWLAGYNNNGSKNVLLGYRAGYDEVNSNRLHISNSDSPLIYGEFDNNLVRINGLLQVTDRTGTATNIASWDGDKIIDSGTAISSLSTFDGVYTSLDFTGTTGLNDGIDNIDDADSDITNELQTISKSGSTVTLSDGGGSFTDENTQLTETQVDNFVSNNGYITSETDEFGGMDFYTGGSTFFYRAEDDLGNVLGDPISFTGGTNISLAQTGNGITINSTASSTPWVDLGSFLSSNNHDIVVNDIDFTLKNTNATLVVGRDANGWLTDVPLFGASISGGTLVMNDVSSSNELQTLSVSGSNLTISSGNTVALPSPSPTPNLYNTHNTSSQSMSGSVVALNLGSANVNLGFSATSTTTNPTGSAYYRISAVVRYAATSTGLVTCQLYDGGTVLTEGRESATSGQSGVVTLSVIDNITSSISIRCGGPSGTIPSVTLSANELR